MRGIHSASLILALLPRPALLGSREGSRNGYRQCEPVGSFYINSSSPPALARSVITVASLSFVGLGVSEPTPEWGGMLSFAKTQMRYYPYLSLFPGFAVVMSVMSLTLAGDGLRDAMDPRLRN